ncbi:MAG: EamA family transporter [Rhizonema sp. NSF051]|nr:EamA family transporter [Rhizonema sp. NSF051]
MGRYEKRPENPRQTDSFGAAETALRVVTEELQIIHRNLLKSLQEDLKRLQVEKIRLSDDIKQLQEEKEQLQGRNISDQQAMVRQLAQVLASHITVQLQSSLESLTNQAVQRVLVGEASRESLGDGTSKLTENTEQLLGSLDDSLTITFNTLQHDLKNYQSRLSQQISQMQSQQQLGEALLAELVNRLREELEKTTAETSSFVIKEAPPQVEPTRLQLETKLQMNSSPDAVPPSNPPPSESIVYPPHRTVPPSVIAAEQAPLKPIERLSLSSTGLWLIVLSTMVSCLYNIAIKVIFRQDSQILGVFEVERLISPTLGNTLLILMLRMLVVVPLMLLLAPILHPQVWQDLQNLVDSVRSRQNHNNANTKRVLVISIVSGCFLFLSQVLIYLAIGHVATGVAIALFFIYPTITGVLSWLLFRDRLNSYSYVAIASICLGELLILGSSTNVGMSNISLGNTTAIASGIAFALYVVLTRQCASKLHPVTFTLINFTTMLLLSFVGLLLRLPVSWSLQVNPDHLLELILSAFILGVLTLCGYLLNIFGIRKIGATRSAIFGASVPALTVIFAGLMIQETLQLIQVFGVMLVSVGTATFSFDKIRNRVNPSSFTK